MWRWAFMAEQRLPASNTYLFSEKCYRSSRIHRVLDSNKSRAGIGRMRQWLSEKNAWRLWKCKCSFVWYVATWNGSRRSYVFAIPRAPTPAGKFMAHISKSEIGSYRSMFRKVNYTLHLLMILRNRHPPESQWLCRCSMLREMRSSSRPVRVKLRQSRWYSAFLIGVLPFCMLCLPRWFLIKIPNCQQAWWNQPMAIWYGWWMMQRQASYESKPLHITRTVSLISEEALLPFMC